MKQSTVSGEKRKRSVGKAIFCLNCPDHKFEDRGTIPNPNFGTELDYEVFCPFESCQWFPGQERPPCRLTKKIMGLEKPKKKKRRKRQQKKKPLKNLTGYLLLEGKSKGKDSRKRKIRRIAKH